MLEIASQMILCLLLAALIGAIIGYILGKSTCDDGNCGGNSTSGHTEHTNDSTDQTHAIAQTASTQDSDNASTDTDESSSQSSTPVILSAPREGGKDNLTRIKGIGVKIDEALNGIGIYHFDQIASWNEENLQWADTNLGFPGRAKRENWVEQAAALAAGEETEFSKRVDKGQVSSSKKA